MDTICLYTKSNRLSQKWKELLSKENSIVICTEFKQLARLCDELNFIVYNSEEDYETICYELDQLVEKSTKRNILVLRSLPDLEEGENLLSHNISGYGNSNMSDDIFIQAINVIKNGSVWLYPDLMEDLINKVNKINANSNALKQLENLTTREKEIATSISEGKTNKAIAKELNISLNTIKVHISSIFEKLGIKNRVALAILLKQ